jgi:hypothetical protein
MWFVRNGYPRPKRDHQFAKDVGRRYSFDLAWPDIELPMLGGLRLAIEIEGGGERGRHMSFTGYAEDCRKYNLALLLGWAVFRFTPQQIKDREHRRLLATIWPILGLDRRRRTAV